MGQNPPLHNNPGNTVTIVEFGKNRYFWQLAGQLPWCRKAKLFGQLSEILALKFHYDCKVALVCVYGIKLCIYLKNFVLLMSTDVSPYSQEVSKTADCSFRLNKISQKCRDWGRTAVSFILWNGDRSRVSIFFLKRPGHLLQKMPCFSLVLGFDLGSRFFHTFDALCTRTTLRIHFQPAFIH